MSKYYSYNIIFNHCLKHLILSNATANSYNLRLSSMRVLQNEHLRGWEIHDKCTDYVPWKVQILSIAKCIGSFQQKDFVNSLNFHR